VVVVIVVVVVLAFVVVVLGDVVTVVFPDSPVVFELVDGNAEDVFVSFAGDVVGVVVVETVVFSSDV
jgi:hypothetical protein